jgi:hypothetical protein
MLRILINAEDLGLHDQAYIPDQPYNPSNHITRVIITDITYNPDQPYIRVVITDIAYNPDQPYLPKCITRVGNNNSPTNISIEV